MATWADFVAGLTTNINIRYICDEAFLRTGKYTQRDEAIHSINAAIPYFKDEWAIFARRGLQGALSAANECIIRTLCDNGSEQRMIIRDTRSGQTALSASGKLDAWKRGGAPKMHSTRDDAMARPGESSEELDLHEEGILGAEDDIMQDMLQEYAMPSILNEGGKRGKIGDAGEAPERIFRQGKVDMARQRMRGAAFRRNYDDDISESLSGSGEKENFMTRQDRSEARQRDYERQVMSRQPTYGASQAPHHGTRDSRAAFWKSMQKK